MYKKIKKFYDTEIQEYKFHQYKSPISTKNIHINKIVEYNKFLAGKQYFKYFIGYKDNKKIRPLCIFFPEMSIYERYSDNTKCKHFVINDEKFFDNNNEKINSDFCT